MFSFVLYLLHSTLPAYLVFIHSEKTSELPPEKNGCFLIFFLGFPLQYSTIFSYCTICDYFKLESAKIERKYLHFGYWALIAATVLQQYGFYLLTLGSSHNQNGRIIFIVTQLLVSFLGTLVCFCTSLEGPNWQEERRTAFSSSYYAIFFAWMATACIRTPTCKSVLTGIAILIMVLAHKRLNDIVIKYENEDDVPVKYLLRHFLLMFVAMYVGYISVKDKENRIWIAHLLYNIDIGLLCIDVNSVYKKDGKLADAPLKQLRRAAGRWRSRSRTCGYSRTFEV